MKKGSWWEKRLKIANDFVIPAEAGIQAFYQLPDFKAKDTGPRLPESRLPGQTSPGRRVQGFSP
jgi:hypothetical protein